MPSPCPILVSPIHQQYIQMILIKNKKSISAEIIVATKKKLVIIVVHNQAIFINLRVTKRKKNQWKLKRQNYTEDILSILSQTEDIILHMFQNNVFWHSQYRPDEKKIIIIVVNLARSMMMIKKMVLKKKRPKNSAEW